MNKKRKYFLDDTFKEYHCNEGKVEFSKSNSVVKTNKNIVFFYNDANLLDLFESFKKGAQSMSLKDLSQIIAFTSLDKNSIVVEAGLGSGFSAFFFARFVKKVISYEVNKKHLKIAKKNIDKSKLKNIFIKEQDIKDMKEKKVDLLLLDLPNPWDFLFLEKNVKLNNYIVCYVPNLNQVFNVVNSVKENKNLFVERIITSQVIDWIVDDKRMKPFYNLFNYQHTGFMVFIRKIM
jgi:tRNA A58 N-methylase Trm61